jgi:spore coat polysaccharide biosynthesis protein SpsF (cytidylyltransferase family)
LDVEVCTFSALERAWRDADQAFEREHVMPYFYEDIPTKSLRSTENAFAVSPRGYRVLLVNHQPDYGTYRWTVDTPQDLTLLRQIYARFNNQDTFTWTDILDLFEREPGLAEINASVKQKTGLEAENPSGSDKPFHKDEGS